MKIRLFKESDSLACVALFRETVHTVCKKDYSQEQLNAWAPDKIDLEKWAMRQAEAFTLVAHQGEQIIGFASLDQKKFVDMLYVSANHQGLGIASRLLAHLEEEAHRRGVREIQSDVSLTARAFFVSRGFTVERDYEKRVGDVSFKNAIMRKHLHVSSTKETARQNEAPTIPSPVSRKLAGPTPSPQALAEKYFPVDCDFTDELEALSVKRKKVIVSHWSPVGKLETNTGTIDNIFTTKAKEEFIKMSDSSLIRLDHIYEIVVVA